MNVKSRCQLHFAVIAVPFSVPLAAGVYWMWLQHVLIIWAGISAVLGAGWWFVSQRVQRLKLDLELLDISSSFEKNTQNNQAYEQIERICASRRNTNPDLASSQFYVQTLLEVMQTVAEHYYPDRKNALLEIKIPYLLKAIEKLAQELRLQLTDNVPGSHIFSLNDLAKSHRLANRGAELYRLFRVVTAGLDPVSAMVRELKILANNKIWELSATDLKSWLIDAYIKKIGYYAIELYSGNMVLDEEGIHARTTRTSRRQLDEINRRETIAATEPLRVLVLGQTNAGKSSLINALFGVKKAAISPMPSEPGIISYLLERPEMGNAIIMDCEGYGGGDCKRLFGKYAAEISRTDIILMAISVTNAAREADNKMLQTIRACFAKSHNHALPPVMVALTHIDQLRPIREWRPPYDVINPSSPKAAAIRQMMDVIKLELHLNSEQIVPVNLKPGFEYNINEGLIPVIYQQLDQANQVRYLRCLKEYQQEEQWRKLWKQSKRAGQFIARKGSGAFEKPSTNESWRTEKSGESPLANPAFY